MVGSGRECRPNFPSACCQANVRFALAVWWLVAFGQLLCLAVASAVFSQEEEDDLPNGFFDYFNEVYCDPVSQYMDFYFFFDFYADSECVTGCVCC